MAMESKRWQVAPPVPQSHLAHLPHLPPLIVQLLYNRGVTAPEEVRDFLAGGTAGESPFRLRGMGKAVARIRHAVRKGEPIAIYGDFDADGMVATALLTQTLEALGARVVPYIPDRADEGYGLNIPALRRLYRQGIQLVVTVDCGIRAIAEVERARRGLDLVITDHHSVGEELPPALAVINPKRADCPYPFKDLAGVGVAFKLAQALLLSHRQQPLRHAEVALAEEDLLDLVALGTVTDMVPLLGENRSLLTKGLERLNDPQRLGLKALISSAGLKPGEIDATAIGYILGPRLNAAGRIGDAMVSYRLLTTDSPLEAEELARKLEGLNRKRQALTEEALERARERALTMGEEKLVFVADEDFLPGIVGLVAGRLTEEFYRPAVVVELGVEESHGSCRSIPELNITVALDECHDLLSRYGGHAAAAGFTVASENIEALQERLREIAEGELSEVELVPTLPIDAEVRLAEMDWATQAQLEQLEPCGYANPVPLFLSRNVEVRDARAVGAEEKHLKLTLSDGRGIWDAIAFRQGHRIAELPPRLDIVYSLEVNEWEGRKRLQLNVKDLRPS